MARIRFLRKVLFLVGLIGLAAVQAAWPAEHSWPTKDITLIVPFRAGAGFDITSRIFGMVWETKLPKKANVIVTNKTGAGGKIGSMALMKSAPDGYTIGTLSPVALALMQINGELENMDIRRLSYLGQIDREDGVVVVSAASGIKTMQDLTKRELRFGVTEDSYFPATMLAKQMGLKARMIMFDGVVDQGLAAMRGDVDIMVDSATGMRREVGNSKGKLLPLFSVSEQRTLEFPQTPTSKELGLELGDLRYIAGGARTLSAPAGIPADLLKAMQDSAWATLSSADFKERMA